MLAKPFGVRAACRRRPMTTSSPLPKPAPPSARLRLCACISPEGELASQDPHEVANFVIHLIGVGDRGRDSVSE